jgi:hypothetical protein
LRVGGSQDNPTSQTQTVSHDSGVDAPARRKTPNILRTDGLVSERRNRRMSRTRTEGMTAARIANV